MDCRQCLTPRTGPRSAVYPIKTKPSDWLWGLPGTCFGDGAAVSSSQRPGGDQDKGLLGSAAVDCLHSPKVLLNKLAEKIIRWDGRGDIPTLSAAEIGSWTPVALPAAGKTRSEHVEWKEQFRVEYVAMAERLARWS